MRQPGEAKGNRSGGFLVSTPPPQPGDASAPPVMLRPRDAPSGQERAAPPARCPPHRLQHHSAPAPAPFRGEGAAAARPPRPSLPEQRRSAPAPPRSAARARSAIHPAAATAAFVSGRRPVRGGGTCAAGPAGGGAAGAGSPRRCPRRLRAPGPRLGRAWTRAPACTVSTAEPRPGSAGGPGG